MNNNNENNAEKKWYNVIPKWLNPILVVFFGSLINHNLEVRKLEESKIQLYSQIMSNREQAECSLRKDMFGQIITSIFGTQPPADLDRRVLNLEILGHNFNESLNLKPLFAHIIRAIHQDSTLSREDSISYSQRIDNVLNDIKQHQLYSLGMYGVNTDLHFKDSADTFFLVDADTADSSVNTFHKTSSKATGIFTLDSLVYRQFQIQIGSVTPDFDINVLVTTRYYNPDGDSTKTLSPITLNLSTCDLPMISTTRLSKNERFAVVLKRVQPNDIVIAFSYFSGEHGGIKDRPYYDEILNRLNLADSTNKSPRKKVQFYSQYNLIKDTSSNR